MGKLQELLALAQSQVGYQEKKSAFMLDDHNGNAGYNNYTKYSRDVDSWGLAGCQGQPWCATYQFWLEAKIFGTDTALKHFHMDRKNYTAYNCFCIYDAFSLAGMASDKPGAGSLVVFRHGHIGRVTKVRGGRVYTNEGNTSALYGDSNGGTVKNKDYSVSDPNILGYCLMDYGEEGELPETHNPGENDLGEASPDGADRVEAFQGWLNVWYPGSLKQHCGKPLKEDGIWGPETEKAALAVWKDILDRLYGCREVWKEPGFGSYCRTAAGKALVKRGDSGTLTAIAEGILAAGGYYKGNIDAVFGNGMELAVREFQEERDLEADGIIGRDTWTALFGRNS